MKTLMGILFLIFFGLSFFSLFALGLSLMLLAFGVNEAWKYLVYAAAAFLYSSFGFVMFGALKDEEI